MAGTSGPFHREIWPKGQEANYNCTACANQYGPGRYVLGLRYRDMEFRRDNIAQIFECSIRRLGSPDENDRNREPPPISGADPQPEASQTYDHRPQQMNPGIVLGPQHEVDAGTGMAKAMQSMLE